MDLRQEIRIFFFVSSKVTELGWSKQRTLDEALEETVAWYRDNRDWWQPIKSGEYREYYDEQYRTRLEEAAGGNGASPEEG